MDPQLEVLLKNLYIINCVIFVTTGGLFGYAIYGILTIHRSLNELLRRTANR